MSRKNAELIMKKSFFYSKQTCLDGAVFETYFLAVARFAGSGITSIGNFTFFADLKRRQNILIVPLIIEPRYEKTSFLHMRKQRRRSASPYKPGCLYRVIMRLYCNILDQMGINI